MKQRFINWLCKKEFAYRLSIKLLANRILRENKILTPQYLIDRGWIKEDGYYIEPNMKDRDLVSISFEDHYYRVWHSKKRTFIALESSVAWFEIYFLIIHPNNGRYELSGI